MQESRLIGILAEKAQRLIDARQRCTVIAEPGNSVKVGMPVSLQVSR